jgi:ribonuclease HII
MISIPLIAGVDEVGRGPLIGSVVTAAVILDPNHPIDGLTDSKKLTQKKREALSILIKRDAFCWALGSANVEEIDRLNILQASLLAMSRAVENLSIHPNHCLIDGSHLPLLNCTCEGIIKGDLTEPAISAASIIAKVARDQAMQQLDIQYPGYGLAQNKGYPTRYHLDALKRLGATPLHRKSFKPVRAIL